LLCHCEIPFELIKINNFEQFSNLQVFSIEFSVNAKLNVGFAHPASSLGCLRKELFRLIPMEKWIENGLQRFILTFYN